MVFFQFVDALDGFQSLLLLLQLELAGFVLDLGCAAGLLGQFLLYGEDPFLVLSLGGGA